VNSLTLQTDTTLFDSFNLLLGGRLDSYSDGYLHLSPRAGLIYHIDSESAVKLLYGHGFRAPAALEIYGGAVFAASPTLLTPETIETEELLYQKQSKTHTLSLGLFYSKWTNGIVLSSQGAPRFHKNSGASHAYGVETDFTYQPGDFGGSIGGSYAKSISTENSTYEEYGAFPKGILNLGVKYKLRAAYMDFSLFNRHYWSMKTTSDSFAVPLKPYFRTDFSAIWDCGPALGEIQGRYQVALNLNNLLNRKNITPSPWNIPGGFEEPGIAGTVYLSANF
jgi:outer membrane receptor protein involved in Fe transport